MCRKSLGIWIESIYIHVLCCLEAKFVLCSCVFKLNKVNISTYQHLAFLHQTLFLNILAGAACSDGMSMSTNRYLWITKQMRLCRVKAPDSTGRTGISCSSRPAKKPLLASNSSPHQHRNVAKNFGEALKTANPSLLLTHFTVMIFQPITAILGAHWMLKFRIIDTEFWGPWELW